MAVVVLGSFGLAVPALVHAETARGQSVILVLGDSLSAGYGVALDSTWVALLQRRLATQGYGHRVVNASVSGETTGGARGRMPRAMELHDPDVVILELGGNDGLRGLPLRQVRQNFEYMIEHAKEAGATVVLVGMRMPPNYGATYADQFHALYGELGNSTASSLEYLDQFWPLLGTLNLNTVLAPVSWELIEPAEGRFDFKSVDGLLAQARAHDMRLVLLWFGAWKNSMSSYVPAWVKRDQARFPRSQMPNGGGMEILSPFSTANRDADARAFAALMAHLRKTDARQQTVVMVQVENEIGMIPHARDYSDTANQLFSGPVPKSLLDYLATHKQQLAAPLRERWRSQGERTQGTWSEVFGGGPATEELFMAWHFAVYVEAVTAAGKKAYPLPMFVNAALIRPGRLPGEYPSAGPLPHLIDVWRAGAPSIDFLAPDIYFPNFVEWARAYAVPGNPLFVPETGRAPIATPANAFYAIGALDAMGFSPFAIESYRADDALGDSYAVLEQIAPLILEHQGTGRMIGFRPPVTFDGTVDARPQSFQLGDYTLHVAFERTPAESAGRPVEAHGGLAIQIGAQEYLVAGKGIIVTFSTPNAIAGIESIYEGKFIAGRWQPGRLLNGDESHQGRHLRIPEDKFGIQRVRLYRYR